VALVYFCQLSNASSISGKVCLSLCLCMSVSVCPLFERKMAQAITTKLGTHISYGSLSACFDPQVKMSRSHGYKKRNSRMAASEVS